MAIKITGTFEPSGDFGLVIDNHLIGSFRIVETLADRDNIPVLRRKFGMLVYVQEENKMYQLINNGNNDLMDNSQWQEFKSSSSGDSWFLSHTLI
jgi:hypothetical protein